MVPRLEQSGILLLVSAALITLVGFVLQSWPLAVIGEAPIFALLGSLSAFFPVLSMLRRRRIELLWWIPGGENARKSRVIGQPFPLQLVFRNRGFRDVALSDVQVLASRALGLAAAQEKTYVVIPAQAEVKLSLQLVPHCAGRWHLHGVTIRVHAPLGFFRAEVYFPSSLELTVLPATLVSRLAAPWQQGALQASNGSHLLQRAGIGTELREIREHAPGDSFKQIAWKASARLSKLMSREFESEVTLEARLLLDVSPSMRHGMLGHTALDQCIAIASAWSRQLLSERDKVGLLVYDQRVVSQVRIGEGLKHHREIVSTLLETQNPVDEDLTSVDEAALYTIIAQYLAYQEGVSVRFREGSSAERMIYGSDGVLYDRYRILRTVEKIMSGVPLSLSPIPQASTSRGVLLRQFCRFRGLELPYRYASDTEETDQANTLAKMLQQTIEQGKGAALLLVMTDLLGVHPNEALARSLALAKKRHQNVVFFVPSTTAPAESGYELEVDVVSRVEERLRTDIAALLRANNVRLLQSKPWDNPASILRMLQRLRR